MGSSSPPKSRSRGSSSGMSPSSEGSPKISPKSSSGADSPPSILDSNPSTKSGSGSGPASGSSTFVPSISSQMLSPKKVCRDSVMAFFLSTSSFSTAS